MSLELATHLIDIIGAFLLITMIIILEAGDLYRCLAQPLTTPICGSSLA